MKTTKKERRFDLKADIIKYAAMLVLSVSALNVSAQKSTVLAAFSKYGIDEAMLNPANVKAPSDYAFDLKESTTTAGKTKLIVARFDPSKPSLEQWTVVSVDGKAPSKADNNTFRKNKVKEQSSEKTDEASYKIEKETADQLTFSYKTDVSSLPKEASFMKDCRSYMTVDLKTKHLEKLEVLNEKPVKINILNTDKFSVSSRFSSDEAPKRYFPVTEDVTIQAKFMGQAVVIQTVNEYSNYTKK